MDWELKESAWDFTNMPPDDDHDPRLAALIASNSFRPKKGGGDFSVDLKLGRLGDTGDETRKAQKCPLNGSGSSKKARAISGTQNVTCLVDGCVDDLTGCREYHRRHRVCERHSKTPVVSIAGKDKRFCQQCSRFQCVSEFDEEKRSCRKRLDGHNRRRRKPQPEAFYTNHGSLFSTTHQGTRLLQFGSPETYTTSAVATWPNGADRRFPFLLTNNDPNNYQSVSQVTLYPPRLAHDSAFANVNHHRAHSLLSSPHPIHNSTFSHSPSLQIERPARHHYFHSPTLVPQPTTYNNGFSGIDISMMSLSPDDLLEKGASQVLPFSWKQ